MSTSTTPDPALEAAREFRATVIGLSNNSTDKLADIIRRHHETTSHSRLAASAFRKLLESEQANAALRAELEHRYPTAWAYEQACKALENTRKERDALAAKVNWLSADLAASMRETAAARADTARLDWLDGIREPRTQWSGDPNDEPELVGYTWGIEAQAMDIRTAIDAAMKEGQP